MNPVTAADYEAWLDRARSRMIALRAPGRPDATEIVDGLVTRLLPDGPASADQRILVGDGAEVWFTTGPDPVVLDLDGDPRVVLPAVHTAARLAGAARMKILVFPTQPELATATAELGYTPVATRMRLAVPDRPGDPAVTLHPMTVEAAAAFAERLVDSYASDLLSSGAAADRASADSTARQQTEELLAEPGSVVLTAIADGQEVGALWLDVDGDETFVLDVVVDPDHRGRGHGRAVMVAAADHARERGCPAVALSVFGDNVIARRLYDSLGYEVTETFLGVDL